MDTYLVIVSQLLLVSPSAAFEINDWLIDLIKVIEAHLSPLDNVMVPTINPHRILFYVYTPHNPKEPFLIRNNLGRVEADLPTKIIIPGWAEYTNKKWVIELKDTYLRRGDYNVIVVNWEFYSTTFYTVTCRQVPAVGEAIASKLIFLFEVHNLNPQKVHIIGHSMGAHVAGSIGRAYYQYTRKKLPRITGLDAAGPLFEMPPLFPRNRLAKTDADFVDAIHTNGLFLGYNGVYGKADFYVNDGKHQPGCFNVTFPENLFNIMNFLYYIVGCSHIRSHEYWMESINSDKFKAKHGRRYAIMGEHCSSTAKGMYFLKTNAKPPFAIG